MKRTLLSLLALISIGTVAQAQMRYSFTTQTGQTYTPLTGGTNIANYIWDDPAVSAPLGFNFILNGVPTDSFHIQTYSYIPFFTSSGINTATDSINGFMAMEADLFDRANNDSTATMGVSPITYAVTGSAPNRVFKLDYTNAGFYEDTLNVNSVNFQVWWYEGSNAVELRYGPSTISPANLTRFFYFGNGGPLVGVVNKVAVATGDGKMYHLKGDPAAPTLDSTDASASTANSLTSYPASGTVYRFTPTSTGINLNEVMATARSLKLYPSAATTAITVEWGGAQGEAYQIIAANGQQVAAGRLQRGTQSIPVNTLTAGAYHLRLSGGSHQFLKH
jgi:hypothetical protein